MTLLTPTFSDDQVYPFWTIRKLMSSLTKPGVVSLGDLAVSPSSGLQVQVAAGSAFVQQTVNIEGGSFYNGLYQFFNYTASNPYNTITAPITNPRIDQVIARIYDVREQGLGGSSKGQLEWLVGSESSSASLTSMGPGTLNPGAAVLPANSYRLAYVLQTVGESSISAGNILDVRSFQDTGWVLMALGTGVAGTSDLPSARQLGDMVYLRGGINNGGVTKATGSTLFTVPSTMKPTVEPGFGVVQAGSGGVSGLVFDLIKASGNAVIDTSNSPAWAGTTPFVSLNGLNYSIT